MIIETLAENTQRATLDNGFRLIITEVPHTRAVSLGFFIGVGARYEGDAVAGASHAVEHMLFKGSRKRPTACDISLAIESVGGSINASTGKESTVYYARVPHEHGELALDVLEDMIRYPLFDPVELEKERRVIVEEIRMMLDEPQSWSHLLLMEQVFPKHPLGRDIAGSVDSVLGMSRDDLLNYVHRNYGAGNAVLSVAGRLSSQRILDRLVPALEDWPSQPVPEFAAVTDTHKKPRVKVGRRKTEQAYLNIAVRSIPRGHLDRFNQVVMNAVMSEGMSSRLFQEVREKRGLAYSVDSWFGTYHDAGIWGISAGVDPKRLPEAYDAILGECTRLREQAIPDEELRKAKEQVKGRLVLGMEDSFSIASWWGRAEAVNDTLMTLDQVLVEIDRVQVEHIQRLAQRLIQPNAMNVTLVGPFGEAEKRELQARLQ